jgi:hypothetical protein
MLSLWTVLRKIPPNAKGSPNEPFIIYDESASPSAGYNLIDVHR